jgi:hypothetical protein
MGVAWLVAWRGLCSLTLDVLTVSISLISLHLLPTAASLLDQRAENPSINAVVNIDDAGRCSTFDLKHTCFTYHWLCCQGLNLKYVRGLVLWYINKHILTTSVSAQLI